MRRDDAVLGQGLWVGGKRMNLGGAQAIYLLNKTRGLKGCERGRGVWVHQPGGMVRAIPF